MRKSLMRLKNSVQKLEQSKWEVRKWRYLENIFFLEMTLNLEKVANIGAPGWLS